MANQETQKKEKKDLKGTLIAALIPKLTDLVVKLIPEKTYSQLFKNKTFLVEIVAPAMGLLVKKFTNLTDEQDDLITELFQEFGQSVEKKNMEKKNTDPSPEEMVRSQKMFQSFFSDNVKKKVQNAFKEFEDLMNEIPDYQKESVLNILSSLNPKAMANFLSSTLEEKKNFLSLFLKENKTEEKKKEEPGEITGIFEGLKSFASKFNTGLNENFKEGSDLMSLSENFRKKAEEFNNQTKLGKVK